MSIEQTNNGKLILNQALRLAEFGWSVIPVGMDKKPLVKWEKYQIAKASRGEITDWFSHFPKANIGVVTGKSSGIIVVDIDPRHGGTDARFSAIETVKAKTGGGGFHYYFQYEEGIENKAGPVPGIDIRGEGGYVVVPPSVHSSSNNYEWVNDPYVTSLAPLPEFIRELMCLPKSSQNGQGENVFGGVAEGKRNESAASVAGTLLSRFTPDEWETGAWPLLQGWNLLNRPPLAVEELRTVFESIKSRETANSKEKLYKSQAARLLERVDNAGLLFFHDQHNTGYSALKGDGREIVKIRSKAFKSWLASYAWGEYKEAISSETTNKVLQILEGKALFSGPEYNLSTRVAEKDGDIWYDLGSGSAVRVNGHGWEVIEKPPILFRRLSHQKVQVLPEKGGSVADLCNLVNLRNEEEKLLLQVLTVSAFIPGFPHPILVLYGPQGAGKTTPLRYLKSLIDPSALQGLAVPDGPREFVQTASHHWFLFLDNLSAIPDWLSDSLSRTVTGDGFSKRELYSDDDDIVYNLQRPLALNGINLVVEKADLLERSVILGLERITSDKRREEKDLWNEFESIKPWLLGAILDAVSAALREYPLVKISNYPRMADFTRWGCAVAKALGYEPKQFLTAYQHNLGRQNEAAIEASSVATAIESFMEGQIFWSGAPSELLEKLNGQADLLKIDKKASYWPKDAARLTKKIQQVQTNLAEIGIKFCRVETSRPRKITLQKVGNLTDAAVSADEFSSVQGRFSDGSPSESGLLSQSTDGEEIQSERPSVSSDSKDSKNGEPSGLGSDGGEKTVAELAKEFMEFDGGLGL